MNFRGRALPLTANHFDEVSIRLDIDPAALWAIIVVETGGFGFLEDRRPKILFERHIFHRLTMGRHDADHPNISRKKTGGYIGGAKEYGRLAMALELDKTAALQSASWGLPQIMGFNYQIAGYVSVEDMVRSFCDSENNQLDAFAAFLAKEDFPHLIRDQSWSTVAQKYNGPQYAKHNYHKRLAKAFKKFKSKGCPDVQVRETQALLYFLGYRPGPVDGLMGSRTSGAILVFQESRDLPTTGTVSDKLVVALQSNLSDGESSYA